MAEARGAEVEPVARGWPRRHHVTVVGLVGAEDGTCVNAGAPRPQVGFVERSQAGTALTAAGVRSG